VDDVAAVLASGGFDEHLLDCGWALAVDAGSHAVTVTRRGLPGCGWQPAEALAHGLYLARVVRDVAPTGTDRDDLALLQLLDELDEWGPGTRMLLSGERGALVVRMQLHGGRGGPVPLGRGANLAEVVDEATELLRALPLR